MLKFQNFFHDWGKITMKSLLCVTFFFFNISFFQAWFLNCQALRNKSQNPVVLAKPLTCIYCELFHSIPQSGKNVKPYHHVEVPKWKLPNLKVKLWKYHNLSMYVFSVIFLSCIPLSSRVFESEDLNG